MQCNSPAFPALPLAVQGLRNLIWQHGYRPMPVYSWDFKEPPPPPGKKPKKRAGKAPLGLDWEKRARQTPPECIRLASVVAQATNTGILCDGLRAIDLDLDEQPLVALTYRLAVDMLGATIVRTRENSPRRLLVYRAAEGEPGKLVITGASHTKDHACKIEVLGKGQQFVSHGRHPSGAVLQWPDGGPADVARVDIPAVTEDQVTAFLNACVPVIDAKPIKPERPKREHTGNGKDHGPLTDDFFANVNMAALGDLAAWVQAVFPKAVYQDGTGAYRVAPEDRGRPDLEEDISLHPDGIRDFGRERGLTPIGTVLLHSGAPDDIRAAFWLCERLGVEPAQLGWRSPFADEHDSAGSNSFSCTSSAELQHPDNKGGGAGGGGGHQEPPPGPDQEPPEDWQNARPLLGDPVLLPPPRPGLPAYYPAPTEDRDTAIARQNETIVAHLFEAERLAEARREVRRRRDAAIGDADFMSDTSDGLTPAEKAAITKRIYREVAQQFGYGDRLPQPPLQLNTGSQGTGKTTTTITTIAATPTASTFLFTEPTLDKARETMGDYRRIATPESPPSRLILGRGQKDPKRPGHYICDRHEAAKHVVQAGLSVGKTMCETCKLQDICGHNRQKREVAAIVAEGDGLVAFAASAYVFLKSPLYSPDHLIVDESVLKLATTSFDVKLATLDDLPIARPADIVMDALRGAFDDLDDIAIPQGAMTGLTTIRQALSELEAAPDPVDHPALAAIRIVLDELNDCEMPSEAKSALTAVDRALRELETIPEARATHKTLLRIRDLIAMPRPIAALLATGIDRAELRKILAALDAAIQRHTPEIDGKMRDGTIIERTETAENGPYGRLRRVADLMRAILVEIGYWRETFDNIFIQDGAVRIGNRRKRIALGPLAELPVRYLADVCKLLTELAPIAALRKAGLDLKLGYVKKLLEEAIAAAEPGTDEHLRQADDLVAAMIPEINRQRATFNAVVVSNGVAEVSKRREAVCGPDTSLLLLDGTGDADWNRRIFGTDRLHHEHTPVPRVAHITGTRNRRYSAMSFTATNRNGQVLDNRLPAAAKLREDVNTILSRLPPGQTMIASTKRVEDALFASGAIPDDTPTAHFGALRGLNRWQDARAAIVIGGETIPLNALERMARAFLADDPQPFVSMDQPAPKGWPRRQWPYVTTRMRRMADGSLSAVKVEVHPDARVQGFYEQIREAEAVQALDRTRPVWQAREIVLLNELCLDVDYDRILSHRELLAGGDKLDQAFLATGLVPRTPLWLHKAHPTIFATIAVAEHALRNNYRDFVNRWVNWKPAVVSFRTVGQRGPASEAVIDASRHPNLQAAIEAVTGPLEEFQGVTRQRDSERPASEPVMRPDTGWISPEPRQPGSGSAPPSNMVHGPPNR